MLNWQCDICGKKTHMAPPTEPVYEEREIEVDGVEMDEREFRDIDDVEKRIRVQVPKTVRKKVRSKVPKMAAMKRQNPESGKVETIAVPEHRDLKPRAFIISLRVGGEKLQRDFCRDCLDSLMPEIKALWTRLETIEPKG